MQLPNAEESRNGYVTEWYYLVWTALWMAMVLLAESKAGMSLTLLR